MSVFLVPPRPDAHFAGRELVLRQLRHVLHHARAVALHGPGGRGKTQTALAYAHRFQAQHRVIAWLSAPDAASLRAGLLRVAAALAERGALWLSQPVADAPDAALTALRGFWTRTADALLIIDDWDAWDAWTRADADSACAALQALPGWPASAEPPRAGDPLPGQLLVLTTDTALLPPRLHTEPLPPLDPGEALTLLARRSDRHKLTADEPAAAAALARHLGHEPRALAQAADWVRARGATWLDCLAAAKHGPLTR